MSTVLVNRFWMQRHEERNGRHSLRPISKSIRANLLRSLQHVVEAQTLIEEQHGIRSTLDFFAVKRDEYGLWLHEARVVFGRDIGPVLWKMHELPEIE